MLHVPTPTQRRQIGVTRLAKIDGGPLDTPYGFRLLARSSAAAQEALILKYLHGEVNLSQDVQRARIEKRILRQQAKVDTLDDDAVVASRVAEIMADDLRLSKFIRCLLEDRNVGESRPLLAEMRTATAQWVEAAAEGVCSKYSDAMPYRRGEDRASAEDLIERFMTSRQLAAGETIQVPAKKMKREDVKDIVDIFDEAQRRG